MLIKRPIPARYRGRPRYISVSRRQALLGALRIAKWGSISASNLTVVREFGYGLRDIIYNEIKKVVMRPRNNRALINDLKRFQKDNLRWRNYFDDLASQEEKKVEERRHQEALEYPDVPVVMDNASLKDFKDNYRKQLDDI